MDLNMTMILLSGWIPKKCIVFMGNDGAVLS